MKHSNGRWHGLVERRTSRGVAQVHNESPLCLILDIESRLRKMNRVDSRAFLEMLRTLSRVRSLSKQTLEGYLDTSIRFLNAPTSALADQNQREVLQLHSFTVFSAASAGVRRD
jgi:hypothetical protein